MNAVHRYSAHGLEIFCELALPEFAWASGSSEDPIEIAETAHLSLPEAHSGERRWIDSAGFHIAWENVGTFHVSPAGHIHFRRVPGASDELIRVPLLGSVLAVALHYREALVMHGNALAVGGKGILLVGAKGQGKSTLSAGLVGRGHRVQADDVATVSLPPEGPVTVCLGTRQLRLWQDSVERSFGGWSPPSRQIHELSEKRVVPLDGQAELPDPLPLARLYVLEDGDEIALQPVSSAEAWQVILVHSLVSRFGTELLTGPGAARHFAACAALAKRVRCVRLRRPRDFSRLGEVAARIEEDLSEE